MNALFRREFARLALSPSAIATTLAFLFGVSIPGFASGKALNAADPAFAQFVGIVPYVMCVIIPVLTMGLWPDEEKNGTYKLLFGYPVGEHEIVLAKFAAVTLFSAILLALTLPVALLSPSGITAARFAHSGSRTIFAAYIALLLFTMTSVAIGEFFSFATRHAIPAFLLTTASLFALFSVTVKDRLNAASRGAMESRDVFFCIGITALFLLLSVRSLERRRRYP